MQEARKGLIHLVGFIILLADFAKIRYPRRIGRTPLRSFPTPPKNLPVFLFNSKAHCYQIRKQNQNDCREVIMDKRCAAALFVFFSALFFLASDSQANGGPVAWTGVTPVGAVGLVQDSDIALHSENLKINVTDFNTYKVQATYELQNDGAAKKVLFGVPLTWPKTDPDGSDLDKDATKNAEKVPAGISLKLNGQPISCTLSSGSTIALKDTVLMGGSADYNYKVNSWCVATLPFAEKAGASLVLEYSAQFFYEDMEFSKSALTRFGARELLYLFYPAGFWKGPVKKVNITVDMSPYTSFKKNQGPAGERTNGRTITWSLSDVDFRRVPKLELVFKTELLEKQQLLTWNGKAGPNEKMPMKVKASSTLHEMGAVNYTPENVLDGKGETAWCEGAQGTGVGEWLQFNLQGKKAGKYCRLEGIAIAPGYVKNQKTYVENGRVRKIRVTDCDGKRPYDFTLRKAERFDMAPVLLQMPVETKKTGFLKMDTTYIEPLDYIEETSCFRLIILEVEKGSSDDTCISEVSLVLNCG